MSERRWSEVDAYVEQTLIGEDPALEAATRASEAGGLPPIALTPAQGKLLHLLARMHGARSVLELGTLGGYSTIWLARALPADGRLITLELDPDYAEVAAANIERAGLAGLVEMRSRSRARRACAGSSRRALVPSILCSSTPTSSARLSTSSSRSSSRVPAA